jgi:hypothetical protein
VPSPSRYVVPRKLADITPRRFLRLEKQLLAGTKEPPKPKLQRPFKRYPKISEEHARRISGLLLRRFKPGDQVGFGDVQAVSQCSQSHARGIIHRLKQLQMWPFAAPPETRGRKPQPKEPQQCES